MTLHPSTLAHRLADVNERDELTTMFCLFTDALVGVRVIAPLLTSWQGAWGEQEMWPLRGHSRETSTEAPWPSCAWSERSCAGLHGAFGHLIGCP